MGSKLKEMDKLFKENELLREELTTMQKKYDLEDIENKLTLYREKDEVTIQLLTTIEELFNSVDSVL